MTSTHFLIQKAIYEAQAKGKPLTSVKISERTVESLALWLSETVWPPASIDDARKAIFARKVTILGVKIEVAKS